MRKPACLALLALALSGCQNMRIAHTPGPQPTQEQAERAIFYDLSRTLKDPDSVKQFAFTKGPVVVTWYQGLLLGNALEQAWLVCVEYNAKNSYGAYVGVKPERYALRVGNDGEARIVPNVYWLYADQHC